jgi:acyl-CoA reductase-like NAD-dependent aldehyde dehydrogenase
VLVRLAAVAGLPEGLLQLLPEPPAEVHAALEAGVDLVVFTGSTEAGRQVIAAATSRLIPAIVELSGEDPFIVREDADPDLAEQTLRFGRTLNGGDSCIAPRRIYAVGPQGATLQARFPDLAVQPVANDEAALREAGASSYALGACVISRDFAVAKRMAARLPAGVVIINDCLMPTADPRLPFGGRGSSGFGVTRGAEGLLALTRLKVIIQQRGARRHLQPAQPGDEQLFLAYLQATHAGGWRARFAGVRALWRALSNRRRTPSHSI